MRTCWPFSLPAERAQLLRIEHRGLGRLSFHHPLIRATVVSGATSGQRLDAHQVLAKALTGKPDRRAWHLAEATPDPDEQVAALLEDTAHRARRRGDAVGAFNALVRSADLTPGPADRARRLAEAAFVGADVAGELRSAAELLVEARRADPELRGSLRAAAAASQVLLNRDGDVNTAHRLLVGAITTRDGRSDGDDEALFEALCTLRRVCLCAGRPEFWDAYQAAMSQLTVPMPPLQELLGDVYSDPARSSPAALGLLDAVIHDLHRETDPSRIERVAMAALFVDRATGCRAALWPVVENGREGGAVTSALIALVVLCSTTSWRVDGTRAALSPRRGWRCARPTAIRCWPSSSTGSRACSPRRAATTTRCGSWHRGSRSGRYPAVPGPSSTSRGT